MTRVADRRTAGLVVFTTVCLLGSWLIAATLRVFDVDLASRRFGPQLFTLSTHYLVTMGWQPLFATWLVTRYVDRVPFDLAMRPSPARFSVVGALSSIAIAAAAASLAFMVPGASTLNGAAEPTIAAGHVASMLVGALLALIFIWLQAVAEEIGWRGYVLPVAMRRFGRFGGLLCQGAAWGLWYAPVLFFSTYGRAPGATASCVYFAISCVFVGVLLGWLRLASGSVVPVVTANVTLTLIAGVPYVVHGVDAGVRAAVFQPIGWVVLAAVVAALFASRWRAVVRVPPEALPPPRLAPLQLLLALDPRRDRTLN